jgi:hypothetical protein
MLLQGHIIQSSLRPYDTNISLTVTVCYYNNLSDRQYGADYNVHGWSGLWSGRSNPEPALNQRAISAVLTAIWLAYMLIPAQFDPA